MRVRFLLLLLLYSPCIFAQSIGLVSDTAYLWRNAATGAVIGQPAVQNDSVTAVFDGGTVRSYSARGELLWSFSVRGRLCPYISRSREEITYICRTNGVLIALNRKGRELWRADSGAALAGPVLLGWDGRIFVPSARRIACYTVSGNLLWKLDLPQSISAGPVLDQTGGVLLALANGSAMRVSPFGEASVWRLSQDGPRILVSVAGSRPAMLALYDNGAMRRVDLAQPGAEAADAGVLPARPIGAAALGVNVAAVLADGRLVLISGADGQILWTAETHTRVLQGRGGAVSETEASVIYDKRGIYVLSANGAAGFSTGGKRLWFTALQNAAGIPALSADGILYSGGTDWILYAWNLESSLLNSGRKLYGPAPEASYGLGSPARSALADPPDQSDESFINTRLRSLRREILAGRTGGNEREWLAWLMEIAQGGYRVGVFSPLRPTVLITHRIQALQLLSLIGSSEAIPWLAAFFRRETEAPVRAAAAKTIGTIGVDPGGRAMQEFLAAAGSGNPVRDAEAFAAMATAIGSLCRFAGPPIFNAASQVLALLIQPEHSALVRRLAQRELDALR